MGCIDGVEHKFTCKRGYIFSCRDSFRPICRIAPLKEYFQNIISDYLLHNSASPQQNIFPSFSASRVGVQSVDSKNVLLSQAPLVGVFSTAISLEYSTIPTFMHMLPQYAGLPLFPILLLAMCDPSEKVWNFLRVPYCFFSLRAALLITFSILFLFSSRLPFRSCLIIFSRRGSPSSSLPWMFYSFFQNIFIRGSSCRTFLLPWTPLESGLEQFELVDNIFL